MMTLAGNSVEFDPKFILVQHLIGIQSLPAPVTGETITIVTVS